MYIDQTRPDQTRLKNFSLIAYLKPFVRAVSDKRFFCFAECLGDGGIDTVLGVNCSVPLTRRGHD